jgi:hypothetical protein
MDDGYCYISMLLIIKKVNRRSLEDYFYLKLNVKLLFQSYGILGNI